MDGDTLQRLGVLVDSLSGRAAQGSEAAMGASFDVRVADCLDLAAHGEAAIAFENLAQNVYDFDVPLTESEYRAFAETGGLLRLSPRAWSFLRDLVTQVGR
ncbi:MafI family immunity protein [Kribbella sp. NPDC058693]|uniref:MafI family immunity protein n=1 Tax=Kribbella sp. NPDC058693 TaxID=3346602 RepID=UPI00365BDF22